MSLEKAMIKRQENALAQLVRVDGEIMTREVHYSKLIAQGAKLGIGEKSSVVWNRRKFNNMTQTEQALYRKKLDAKVAVYKLEFPDGSFYELPKIVYDYFKEKEVSNDKL